MLSCGRSDETTGGGGGGGCDSVLPLRMCQGQYFQTQDGLEVVVSGRESIITDPDVRGEICVMLDQLPVVVPRSAAVPLAVGRSVGRSDETTRWRWLELSLAGGHEYRTPR